MMPAQICTSQGGTDPSSERFRYVDTPWGLQKLRISSDRGIENVADEDGGTELSEKNAGDDDDDCGRPPAKNVWDTVLPFQRWRDFQLKNMFISELKKVLEEARRDEAAMVSMEQELASKERDLQEALAVAARLRVELAVSKHTSESCNAASRVEQLQAEMQKALMRAASSEKEVLKRDKEIVCLKEKLKLLEHGSRKTEIELKTVGRLLHPRKDDDLSENRIDSKDQECRKGGGVQCAVSQVSTQGLSLQNEWQCSVKKGNLEDSHRPLSIQYNNASGSDVVGTDASPIKESIKTEDLQTRDVGAFEVKSEGPYVKFDKVELLKLSSSLAWKWRWAAAASRLKLTLERINDSDSCSEVHQSAQCSHDGSFTELKAGKMIVGLARKDLAVTIPVCRMQRIVFSMWRAYAKVSRLLKRAYTHKRFADKFIAALPCWLHKIGERRKLERTFLHWLLETLRSNDKRKGMKRENCMYDSFRHFCLKKRPDSSQSSKSVSYNSDPKQELTLLPSACEESVRDGGYQSWNPRAGYMSSAPKSSKLGAYVGHARSGNSGTYVGYSARQMGGWQKILSHRALHALQASLQMELEELQVLIVQGLQALHGQASKKRTSSSRMDVYWSCESKRSIVYLLEFLQKLGHVMTELRIQINAFASDSNSVLHSKKIHQGLPELCEKNQYRNHRDDTYCKSKDHHNGHALSEISQDCNLAVGMNKQQLHENIVSTAAKSSADKSSGCTKKRICLAAQYAALLKNEMNDLKEGNVLGGASIEKKLGSKKKGFRGP